ncbi:MAG: hypothetical protein KatS3mg090_0451 [Patescibacteria group bacterium]|nr:MAG: hypothetical protein KatS3mg090_0451 [Patescibacteria group bacterium]
MNTSDPLLKGKDIPIDETLYINSIESKQIDKVAAFTQLIWELGGGNKIYRTREIMLNVIECIKDSSIQKDKLWIPKAAAMLRELTDNFSEATLKKHIKFFPNRGENENVDKLYRKITILKKVLNDIAHLRYKSAIDEINKNKLNDTVVEAINKKILDKIVYEYIKSLYELFVFLER